MPPARPTAHAYDANGLQVRQHRSGRRSSSTTPSSRLSCPTAPTVSAACGCRCIAAASCALPVGPGAIWTRRVSAGVKSSSARPPCRSLQPTGSARHTAASRRQGFPDSHWQQPDSTPPLPPYRVRLFQLAQTWHSSSRPSRVLCQAAAAKRTCSSAAFPYNWRSSWALAMRRWVPGRMPPGIGGVAVWSFPIRCRTVTS